MPRLRAGFGAWAATGALALLVVLAPATLYASAAEPSARPADAAAPADRGMPAAPVIAFGLLSLCGLAAVAVVIARLHRVARRRAPALEHAEQPADAVEQELQAIIAETLAYEQRTRAP